MRVESEEESEEINGMNRENCFGSGALAFKRLTIIEFHDLRILNRMAYFGTT